MCTVSWVRVGSGYALYCNRDEQRTRGPERAPQVFERDGIQYLSPRDGEAGGTWVTANEFGLSIALLNGYALSRGSARSEWTSRGLLVDRLAHLETVAAFGERLGALDLSVYQPFQVVSLDAQGALAILRWDGLELELRAAPEEEMPLVSSGVEAPKVRAHRQGVLRRLADDEGGVTPRLLESYHRNHEGGPSELSTCMHREDAKTRSLCHVAVNEHEVRFDYTPGSPCKTEWGVSLRLPLQPKSVRRSESSGR